MTIILGIDPGSRTTGYGVIESLRGQPRYIASGCIRLAAQGHLAARLECLYTSLQSLVSEYQPTHAAIEQVFVGKSAGSALKLGQARGVAMLVPTLAGAEVHEYAPRTIKQAVAGTGAADKQQVQAMVVRLLKLNAAPAEDAADALAVALCHLYSSTYRALVKPHLEAAL